MWRNPESPPELREQGEKPAPGTEPVGEGAGISPAEEPGSVSSPSSKVGRLTLLSFGFKYGPPPANHVFDVSFLTNPAREERFGLFADRDAEMRRFVLEQPAASEFLELVVPLIAQLVRCDDDTRVALGCSGGRHRSTILVEEIARILRSTGLEVRIVHREEMPS